MKVTRLEPMDLGELWTTVEEKEGIFFAKDKADESFGRIAFSRGNGRSPPVFFEYIERCEEVIQVLEAENPPPTQPAENDVHKSRPVPLLLRDIERLLLAAAGTDPEVLRVKATL